MNKKKWFSFENCLKMQDLFLNKIKNNELQDCDKQLLNNFRSLSKYGDAGSGIIGFFDTLKILVDNEYLEITNGKL